MIYIHPYSHSMIRIIVVRLPYILVNPVKISKYIENTNEISSHPHAVNSAPGSCLLRVVLARFFLLGRNLYTRSQNTVSTISVTNVRIRIIKSTTLLRNGRCSYSIALILFPNTDTTSESMIARRKITVYREALSLR